jgi:RimJ/RimL family protein N-acetyltransferase
MTTDTLPWCEPIETARLRLSPMSIEDADELFAVLDDARLHRFTGGRPDTRDEATARLRAWSTERSPDGNEAWCNWVVRTIDAAVVGTVQATIWRSRPGEGMHASLAWVVGWDHQGQGYASEAARGLAGWLRELGVQALEASIHPGHEASQGVARAIGLRPTSEVVDGEVVWRSVEPASDAG